MSAADVKALQTCLAGEHAALYVLSSLGAQTSQTARPALYDVVVKAWAAHRRTRDRLQAAITARGATPVGAAPSYALPNKASSPAQVRRAALVTEQRMTDVYGTLVASTTHDLRGWAIATMDASARRQLDLGGRPQPFPGTGGLTNR